MEIRIYEKTELALLYFPRSEAKVALNRLKRWIKNNPELSEGPRRLQGGQICQVL